MKFLTLTLCLLITQGWISDPPQKKLIVITGSDWCPNCKRLDKSVLKDSGFINFIQSNHIYLDIVDFPQRSSQHDSIRLKNRETAEFCQFDGTFPGVFLLDLSDSSLRKIDYNNDNSLEFCKALMP
jgi:thioredoxin-related protein